MNESQESIRKAECMPDIRLSSLSPSPTQSSCPIPTGIEVSTTLLVNYLLILE